ncbi:DUF3642 domain-containing protein [Lactobacillus sp. PV034]|uniref:DUF3642 domain-containing protein n=1 Tax=Lactobacillus sp. PV034 TaxID=2594495 RepID=UPI0022405C80|nr:DUF3642 domain-containing protein [Lactobacillus sp. PV034]QNQ80546.1 hypothetical protein FP432_02770 [Lactobacillus sp. PV034]
MKKVVGIASMILAMTSLAACSNKTTQPKGSTAKSSQVTKTKVAEIAGTYQDGKNAVILFKKDGTGRYVSRKDDLDAEFTWKKKNSSTFVVTINDRKNNHEFTAKLAKGKLKLKDADDQTETFKRVKGHKLNLDNFLAKDKSSENQVATSNAEQKSTVAGDEGLFDIPADMQGTWYSADNAGNDNSSITTLTLDKHRISYRNQEESGTVILHKMTKGFDFSRYVQDQSYTEATKNWSRGYLETYRGRRLLHTYSWMQSAGAGGYYYLAHEDGQTVLVSASGAGMWANAIYWKDQATAQKNANKSFSDIPTQDNDATLNSDNSDDE